jgi:hypothetical protein
MNRTRTPKDAFNNGNQLPTEATLSRTLGLFTITMIGAGNFVLTGIAAGAGPRTARFTTWSF